MKNSKKIFLYTLYTLVALLFFLYLRFPSQTVKELIVAEVVKAKPELQVSTEGAHPIFPPGLKLKPFALAYDDIPIVRMAHLKMVPGLISMFRQNKEMDFNGPVGSGSLKGNAQIALDERRPKINVTMSLTHIPAEALDLLDMWPDYKLSGEINSHVTYDSRKGVGGTTRVNTDITPAKIVLNEPLMGIEQMEFTQIVAEMTVTPRMLQISRCEAFGNQIEGKITGSVIFRQPLKSSRINLSCTLKPQPAFAAEHKNDMIGGLLGSENAQKRGVVFRISGTLGNPSYVVR
jgi:type II secretion system protein N